MTRHDLTRHITRAGNLPISARAALHSKCKWLVVSPRPPPCAICMSPTARSHITSCSAYDSARADNAPRSNPHGPVAVPRDPAPSSYPDMSVLHVREQHALTTVQSPTPAIPISREPVTLGAHARQLRPGSHLVLPERSHLVLPERSVGQARNV